MSKNEDVHRMALFSLFGVFTAVSKWFGSQRGLLMRVSTNRNLCFRRPPANVSGLTVSMLDALSNVRVVTEFVEIQAAEYSPTSLSFLRSLTTIEGRKLS